MNKWVIGVLVFIAGILVGAGWLWVGLSYDLAWPLVPQDARIIVVAGPLPTDAVVKADGTVLMAHRFFLVPEGTTTADWECQSARTVAQQ